LIEKRAGEYKLYGKLPSYSRLVFFKGVFNKKHLNINSAGLLDKPGGLFGTPCSAGLATGEVLIVNSPKDAVDIKDKILVTKMTDPGWVFLLTMAKGVIAEKGSLLSHTAIISRELNIPSIVGAVNATSILKTGDRVSMDGSTGEIKVLAVENV
ncbi:MAG: phosphoenolpyruvate synthase, partial [Clostridiales bacterium]|nr:phosphoenolpyruvate synthase [Clostridiales bacterium]